MTVRQLIERLSALKSHQDAEVVFPMRRGQNRAEFRIGHVLLHPTITEKIYLVQDEIREEANNET